MKQSAVEVSQDLSLSLKALEQDALNRPKPMIRVGSDGEPLLQFILEQALRAGLLRRPWCCIRMMPSPSPL